MSRKELPIASIDRIENVSGSFALHVRTAEVGPPLVFPANESKLFDLHEGEPLTVGNADYLLDKNSYEGIADALHVPRR